jgi:hypothetical protein
MMEDPPQKKIEERKECLLFPKPCPIFQMFIGLMRLSHFRQWLFDVAANFSATFSKKAETKITQKCMQIEIKDQLLQLDFRFLSGFDTNGTILITDQLMLEVLAYLNGCK